MNREIRHSIDSFGLKSLDGGELLIGGLPPGVKALDLWSNGRYGSVLFWVDRDLDFYGFGQSALHHLDAQHRWRGKWRSTGGGGLGVDEEPDEILADMPSGLHKLGSGTQDPRRVTIGIASYDVAAIRLRDETGSRDRPLGVDGFFLLGITYQDPVTYAYAIDSDGQELPVEPILL